MLATRRVDSALSGADLGKVEPYQQVKEYSCGAAVLKAVMQHYGEYADEPTLIEEVGVDPDRGSTCEQVADAAQRRGYSARVMKFQSLDELTIFTERDIPVILAIRSFNRPNQGHFVVATEVNDRVHIMDPNVAGNRRTLSRSEADKRWQFRDRLGVVVLPKRSGKRKNGFGEASLGSYSKIALGAVIVAILIGAGVLIYRRR